MMTQSCQIYTTRENLKGEIFPMGYFFMLFPKNIHYFPFFEASFRPILLE